MKMELGIAALMLFAAQGVVIVDNVLFYEGQDTLRTINTGECVEILSETGDFVKVRIGKATGSLHSGVLVNLQDDLALEKLFVFARGYFDQGEYVPAIRLFHVIHTTFASSPYLPEVLYYYGRSYEEVAGHYGSRDSVPGCFYNEHYQRWYYSGDLYTILLEQYPASAFAPRAAYRLLTILRMHNVPWKDSYDVILEELDLWMDFAAKYEDAEEYVLALLEIGYLNRVLYEITDDSDYKRAASDIFNRIVDLYPESIHTAQARINLREIADGEHIYKY